MKVYYLVFLIIILFIWLNKKEKEKFVNNDDTKILDTLKNSWDRILDITEPKIKRFNNSSQISVSNIIKLTRIKDYIYNYKNSILNKKIIYNYSLDEHINNHSTSIIIGNSFSANKNSNSYGFTVSYNPDNEIHNFAHIGIGFKSKINFDKINNLKKIKKNKLERKVLEYFNFKKKIKFIGIFENQNNLEFINNLSVPKKFNLVDFYGNRILTKCTIDFPYCNIELPVKKNIRGRNGYVVGKYNPKQRGIVLLKNGEELKKYDTIKECEIDRNKNIDSINDINKTILISSDDSMFVKDKDFIDKKFIQETGLFCKKHNSEFIDKYYYGGIDLEDEKYKCYSSNNTECDLFNTEEECTKVYKKIINKK